MFSSLRTQNTLWICRNLLGFLLFSCLAERRGMCPVLSSHLISINVHWATADLNLYAMVRLWGRGVHWNLTTGQKYVNFSSSLGPWCHVISFCPQLLTLNAECYARNVRGRGGWRGLAGSLSYFLKTLNCLVILPVEFGTLKCFSALNSTKMQSLVLKALIFVLPVVVTNP